MSSSEPRRLAFLTKRDCLVLGAASLLSFAIENSIGLVLNLIVAVPLVGGVISAWFDSFLIFLTLFIVPRVGAPTLFSTILLALSTVTPSFGPPGAYKILIGVGLGVSVDLALLLNGRSKAGYIVSIAMGFATSIPMTYAVWKVYWPSQAIDLEKYVLGLTAVYAGIAAIGCSVALWFYSRWLAHIPIIQSLRHGNPSP